MEITTLVQSKDNIIETLQVANHLVITNSNAICDKTQLDVPKFEFSVQMLSI